jgi:hypothetical protein
MDYFGAKALTVNEKNAATFQAGEAGVKCFKINNDKFGSFIIPVLNSLKEQAKICKKFIHMRV